MIPRAPAGTVQVHVAYSLSTTAVGEIFVLRNIRVKSVRVQQFFVLYNTLTHVQLRNMYTLKIFRAFQFCTLTIVYEKFLTTKISPITKQRMSYT